MDIKTTFDKKNQLEDKASGHKSRKKPQQFNSTPKKFKVFQKTSRNRRNSKTLEGVLLMWKLYKNIKNTDTKI